MKKLGSIVFWGAFWGLTEATLGYALHAFSLNIGWLFWFPLAFYFISSVYKQTNSLSSVIFTSFLAAAVKMADFLLPTSPDRVINPAVSIILEGLAVFVLFKTAADKRAFRPGYLGVFAASIGWRILYIAYILVMPESFAVISPLRSTSALVSFLFVESLANVLLIWGCTKAFGLAVIKVKQVKREPNGVAGIAFSFLMLAAAIFVQWAL